jgi:hypothetical protein
MVSDGSFCFASDEEDILPTFFELLALSYI